MELTIRVRTDGMMTTREAANIAGKMAAYRAQVLLRRGDITVNAKSLMGLLSVGLGDGMGVTILADGEDEAQAVCALSALLGIVLGITSLADRPGLFGFALTAALVLSALACCQALLRNSFGPPWPSRLLNERMPLGAESENSDDDDDEEEDLFP